METELKNMTPSQRQLYDWGVDPEVRDHVASFLDYGEDAEPFENPLEAVEFLESLAEAYEGNWEQDFAPHLFSAASDLRANYNRKQFKKLETMVVELRAEGAGQ